MKGQRENCGESLTVVNKETNMCLLNDQEDLCPSMSMGSKPSLTELVFMLSLSVWLRTIYSKNNKIKTIGGSGMDETLGFKYTRGGFSTNLIVYDLGSINFYNEEYPEDTPDDMKLDFLEEAEEAVIKRLEEKKYGNVVLWG